MPKPKLGKTSKRMTCHKRYKIIKKIREHNKKVRKEEKNSSNKKRKDPGIPNMYPFKEQLLKQIEERKEKEKDDKEKLKEERSQEKTRKRKLLDLQKNAEKRAKLFDQKTEMDINHAKVFKTGPVELSRKSYYKEFRKVVEASDVIIQVLDARDPLGCRCPQIEELVMASGNNKRIVLLLNKVDLVPKEIVQSWLKYLRGEFPTVAFKASTQNQKQKLNQSKVTIEKASTDLLQTSSCIGASVLMKLLGNYCRNRDVKTSITVGIVGFPNVGKSSVINSLKRSKACNVGSTPGITKAMQEIQLDKHVKLLDCPGIVMATGNSDTQIILKNVVKVEALDDPVRPVEAILSRCNKDQIMQKYCVGNYDDTPEFLTLFAKRLGKLKKGGIPDSLAAAKVLLQDWNNGKITFYTHPPERESTATIVSHWRTEFDIVALEKAEKDDLNELADSLGAALVLAPSKPTNAEIEDEENENPQEMDGEDDEEIDSEEGEEEEEEEMSADDDKEVRINTRSMKESVIAMKTSKKKQTKKEIEETKQEKEKADKMEENNPRVNSLRKRAFKSKQKEQRKQGKRGVEIEKSKMADSDDDYDINQAL